LGFALCPYPLINQGLGGIPAAIWETHGWKSIPFLHPIEGFVPHLGILADAPNANETVRGSFAVIATHRVSSWVVIIVDLFSGE